MIDDRRVQDESSWSGDGPPEYEYAVGSLKDALTQLSRRELREAQEEESMRRRGVQPPG